MATAPPINPGQASMAMQGIGMLTSMIGAYSSVQAVKTNLRAQAEMAAINAAIAETAAQSVLFAGQRSAQRSMLNTAVLKATQRVGFAAGGVDLGEGSAQRVLTSTDVMGEIDKNTIEANAVRDAWGYRTQGVNYQADATRARGAADAASPFLGAATSLIGSAGQVAQNWYMLDKAGAFGNGSAPPPSKAPSDPPTSYWGP